MFKHMITNYSNYSWNTSSNSWSIDGTGILFYSQQNINATVLVYEKSLSVFPNPGQENIRLNFIVNISEPILVEIFQLKDQNLNPNN